MNYLAHAYLSGPNDELKLGNFLGDFVKGHVDKYQHPGTSETVRNGIRLHRFIDSFTDQHAVVRQSKARLVPRYGLLSGVIVDLFYDHFLAIDWENQAVEPLTVFTQQFYALLIESRERLPLQTHRMMDAMIQYDWLSGYAQVEGIERALSGLSRRVPVAAGIETAGEELRTHYQDFKADFQLFMPELLAFSQKFIANLETA